MPAEKRDLANKPLAEAVFEFRWALSAAGALVPGTQRDPHYAVLPGLLYEQLRAAYPFTEQLPAAAVPGDFIAHIVQHRFRSAEGEWPLVQLGPGVVTANDTTGYTWVSFQQQIERLVSALMKAYPSDSDLRPVAVVLRYINAIPFDYEKDDAFEFLRDKLHVGVALPDDLFAEGVERAPSGLDFRTTFPAPSLGGALNLRVAAGMRDDERVLVWELAAQVADDGAPTDASAVIGWTEVAHSLLETWFFTLIEGPLYEDFM
jgi:uncharacterized protein (TIGR04255 family)